jgi:hypothetical protein
MVNTGKPINLYKPEMMDTVGNTILTLSENFQKINNIFIDNRPAKSISFEGQSLSGGSSVILFDKTGAGKITSIFIVLAGTSLYNAYNTRIKFYIDDNITPCIDMPVQDFFFSRGFSPDSGNGTQWRSDKVGMSKHYVIADTDYRLGFYRYIDIPYIQSCKIILSNGDNLIPISFWCQIYYKEGIHVIDNFFGKYNINYIGSEFGYLTGRIVEPYEIVNLLNLTDGSGKLESVWLTIYQSPGQPWVEGNINIYIDGESEPSIKSSGTEDFFMSAFAWIGEYHTQNHGCVVRQGNGYTNVYRFLLPEQIHFSNGIRMTWQAGQQSQGEVTLNLELWSAIGYYLDF